MDEKKKDFNKFLGQIKDIYDYVDCKWLNFGYRSVRIAKEINENKADIVCLQELNNVLVYESLFKQHGYNLEHYLGFRG